MSWHYLGLLLAVGGLWLRFLWRVHRGTSSWRISQLKRFDGEELE